MEFLQGEGARRSIRSYLGKIVGTQDSWSLAWATDDGSRPELLELLLENDAGLQAVEMRTVDVSTSFAFALPDYRDLGRCFLISRVMPVATVVESVEGGEYFSERAALTLPEVKFCEYLCELGFVTIGGDVACSASLCFDSYDGRYLTLFEVLFEWWEDTGGEALPFPSVERR